MDHQEGGEIAERTTLSRKESCRLLEVQDNGAWQSETPLDKNGMKRVAGRGFHW